MLPGCAGQDLADQDFTGHPGRQRPGLGWSGGSRSGSGPGSKPAPRPEGLRQLRPPAQSHRPQAAPRVALLKGGSGRGRRRRDGLAGRATAGHRAVLEDEAELKALLDGHGAAPALGVQGWDQGWASAVAARRSRSWWMLPRAAFKAGGSRMGGFNDEELPGATEAKKPRCPPWGPVACSERAATSVGRRPERKTPRDPCRCPWRSVNGRTVSGGRQLSVSGHKPAVRAVTPRVKVSIIVLVPPF